MRSFWRGVSAVFLLFALILTLGAAQPFERLTEDNPAYSYLAVLDETGLISDFGPPDGELSRLEFAVLTQQALTAYGSAQLGGIPADVRSEDALTWLLGEFAEELDLLGSPVNMPQLQTAMTDGLERRVSYLEDEFEDFDDDSWYERETYLDQLYPCACEEDAHQEPSTEVEIYGDIYLQGRYESTSYTNTDDDYEYSDLELYWGELGVDVSDGTWSGHFSVLIDDETDEVTGYEYYGRYHPPAGDWFFQAGKSELPFSNNPSYFPTFPATYDLGLTVVPSVGFGLEEPDWGLSAWLFNPDVEVDDEEDHFTDYSVVWNISRRRANECRNGWGLTAGYTSHLAAHDLHLGGEDSVVDRNDAINIFGRYDWGGDRCHLLADYTHTLDEFNPADLDADGDAVGDQPSALNLEFVYEPRPDRLWGLSLQQTNELVDYAETRYGLLYGKRLSELAMFKLEYTHGEYSEFVTAAQDTDDTLVAELNLEF